MTSSINEACSCGALFDVTSEHLTTVQLAAQQWRESHLHTPTLAQMNELIDELEHPSEVVESHDARLERAPWWSEVTDPDEIIPAGCPIRKEPRGNWDTTITETVRNFDRETSCWGLTGTVFRDTRWTPPRPAYEVVDVIENAEGVKHLPDGSVFLDCDGDAWQVDDGIAYRARGGLRFVDGDFDYLPLTVIYVPKVKEEE